MNRTKYNTVAVRKSLVCSLQRIHCVFVYKFPLAVVAVLVVDMVGYATIPTFSSGCVYTRMWRISFVVKIINAIIFIVIALDGVGFTAIHGSGAISWPCGSLYIYC